MSIVGTIICAVVLSYIGYVALKYGFHKGTAREKMINILHPVHLPKKPPPKWYAVLPGTACWLVAIYANIEIFSK